VRTSWLTRCDLQIQSVLLHPDISQSLLEFIPTRSTQVMTSTATGSSDLGTSSQPHVRPTRLRTEDEKTPETQDQEKPPFLYTTEKDGETEDSFDDNDPRVKDIPPYVRRVVSYTDDPTLPTLTFRYFLLSVVFVVPGAFLSMMSHYRTTYAPYSIFFVQIASSYVGAWLAKILPAWNIRLPFTTWSFSLNPGPFSVKEHVLITITAASGATYNLGYAPVSLIELYFGAKMHPLVAIFFMWAIVWTGYSFAAIARQFLIYDPQFPWFTA
jgi:hypothetical protein